MLVSAALIAWLVHMAAPASLLDAARHMSVQALGLAATIAVVANGLAALRQWIILRALGLDLPLTRSVALYWFGLFANNFLPSSVGGDAAIAALLHRRHRRLATILAALILNRVIGLASLLMLLLALYVTADLGPLQVLANEIFKWSIYLLVAMCFCLGLVAGIAKSRLRLVRFLGSLQAQIRAIVDAALSARLAIALAIGISFLVTVLGATATVVLANSQNATPGPQIVTMISLMLALIQMVPISFNGIGMAESALTYCLSQYGWQIHEAVLLGLLVRVLTIAISLPGAISLMLPTRNE
ncbi:MAG TPA: lysylphosphatidylglycerol synthase transmembrane domain-containing protein [Dongiaceae bacterium]